MHGCQGGMHGHQGVWLPRGACVVVGGVWLLGGGVVCLSTCWDTTPPPSRHPQEQILP